MNIPEDVYAAADKAGFEAPLEPAYYEYQVIAEWARKQTLEEAEKAIADFFQDSAEMSHWAQGGRDAMDAVRALGEAR